MELFELVEKSYEKFRTLGFKRDEKLIKRVLENAREIYDDKPYTDSELEKILIEEWGSETALHGYAVFSGGDEPHALHVCKIDELAVYDSDKDASKRAVKDGIKLIPYNEQRKDGAFKYYRFIDNEENRMVLQNEACCY